MVMHPNSHGSGTERGVLTRIMRLSVRRSEVLLGGEARRDDPHVRVPIRTKVTTISLLMQWHE